MTRSSAAHKTLLSSPSYVFVLHWVIYSFEFKMNELQASNPPDSPPKPNHPNPVSAAGRLVPTRSQSLMAPLFSNSSAMLLVAPHTPSGRLLARRSIRCLFGAFALRQCRQCIRAIVEGGRIGRSWTTWANLYYLKILQLLRTHTYDSTRSQSPWPPHDADISKHINSHTGAWRAFRPPIFRRGRHPRATHSALCHTL